MRVEVNGSVEEVSEGATLADLIARYKLAPVRVAVEVNCELVRRAEYEKTSLRDGDRVEIVTLVGGG